VEPSLTHAGRPAQRPIRHVEFQVASTDDLRRWYEHYGLVLPSVTDHGAGKTPPRYHRGESSRSTNIVEVGG
jgi:hypothetical protein